MRIAADPEAVWRLAVDWPRQREWIWATRTRGGHGVGATVTGWTGIGPVGFTDTMVITEWEPPVSCTVAHTGSVVRGEGVFEVLPRPGGCEFRWTERIWLPQALIDLLPGAVLPAVTAIVYALLAPAARAGLGSSVARFARLAAREAAGPEREHAGPGQSVRAR